MTFTRGKTRVVRTFNFGDYLISELEFRPDDGFPLCLGYMVGEDDGNTSLSTTPEKAIEAFNARAK